MAVLPFGRPQTHEADRRDVPANRTAPIQCARVIEAAKARIAVANVSVAGAEEMIRARQMIDVCKAYTADLNMMVASGDDPSHYDAPCRAKS
jgi:hypothetical protein